MDQPLRKRRIMNYTFENYICSLSLSLSFSSPLALRRSDYLSIRITAAWNNSETIYISIYKLWHFVERDREYASIVVIRGYKYLGRKVAARLGKGNNIYPASKIEAPPMINKRSRSLSLSLSRLLLKEMAKKYRFFFFFFLNSIVPVS